MLSTDAIKVTLNSVRDEPNDQPIHKSVSMNPTGNSQNAQQMIAISEAEMIALDLKYKMLAAQLDSLLDVLIARFPHDKDFIETLTTASLNLVRRTDTTDAHFSYTELHAP